MKNNLLQVVVTVILLSFVVSCRCKCENNDPLKDPRLVGEWRVDSLMNIQGGNVRTSLMDTIYDRSYYINRSLVIWFKDNFRIAAYNYSFDITGVYLLKTATQLELDIVELKDLALRSKSDFQPLVVGAMNDISSYRIEGDCSKGSRLLIYYAFGNAVIKFTKM